ncbi:MAG: Hsp20/alpha crystallin family protein [Actinomycetota bacterium]|nr:Hsp20/alpha crystallin family protein [Actinomycetota bacterium]
MEKNLVEKLLEPEDVQSQVERFFMHLGRWKRPLFYFEKAWKPRCDVIETEDEVVVVAELAGVDVSSLDVRVEGDMLFLGGMRARPMSEERMNFHIMEINYGPFEREISLPCEVEAEKAKANLEDGFLEIRLPKVVLNGKQLEVDVDVPFQ